MALKAPGKRLFRSAEPKRVRVLYASPGYDLGIGGHNRYTCDGHEVDAIYCDSRDMKIVVARKPNSRKKYVGFDYNLQTGQSKFLDFSMSEKDIDKMTSSMDRLCKNTW